MEWLPEHDAKLKDYRAQGHTYVDIARMLNFLFDSEEFTKDSCQGRMSRLTRSPVLIDAPIEPMPYFRKYFDAEGQPYAVADKPLFEYVAALLAERRHVECLVTSDWHINQHDEELLTLVFNRHQSAEVHAIAGDMADMFALSRFEKDSNHPLEFELENIVRLLEFSSSAYPVTVIIDSNHLRRAKRAASVPMGLQFLLEHNLMRHLALPFDNVFVVDNWYTQLGDALITHADLYRGTAPKSAQAVHNYMGKMHRAGHLDLEPWRLLVQAHTHQVGSWMDGSVKLGETGCLAKLPLQYTTDMSAVRYAQPHINGYYTIVQRFGRTDLNMSREWYLGG